MGLDKHLQASTMAGLVSKYRGASNFLNDKTNSSQASRVVILRAKSRRESLIFPTEAVTRLLEETKATHVVMGVTYGAEAYCVFTQDLDNNFDDEEAREESRDEANKYLSNLATKLVASLEETQNLAEFQDQFNDEEKKILTRIKCRLYADFQTPAAKECSVFDAYKHCLKLMEQVQKSYDRESKLVPISVFMCPLNHVINKSTKRIAKLLHYRDVDDKLVDRFCRIWTELGRVMGEAEAIRFVVNKNSQAHLRQFIEAIDQFQVFLKKKLKTALVKARESEDDEDGDEELTGIAITVENHPLFKPKSLELWLRYKIAQSDIFEKMNKTKGLILFLSQKFLSNALADSEKKYALVLCVPSVDQRTKEILAKMKDCIKSDKILTGRNSEEEEEEVKDPWHMDRRKRKQVLDKIRQLVEYAERNKYVEDTVQFLMLSSDIEQCRYSVYERDNVLKENIHHLPCPPTGLKIKTKTLSSVHIEWDHEELGYPFQYLVEYRLKDDDYGWKQQKITKPGEHQIILNIQKGSVIAIRLATETCIGRSDCSDLIFSNSKTNRFIGVANISETDRFNSLKHSSDLVFDLNFKGIDQKYCIEMTALGRPFELGNFYDYRNDILTGIVYG